MTLTREPSLNRQVEETLSLGESYRNAILLLDPRLLQIGAEDTSVAFDIGRGPDAVAFALLGFQHAIVTNSPSPLWQLAFRKSAAQEQDISTQVQTRFPTDTYFSSLSYSDWLSMPDFHPRLVTMLRIAPQYFNEDDPSQTLLEFIQFSQRLNPNSTVVLSALDDHELSAQAFAKAGELLNAQKIEHKLYIDDQVPPQLQSLGQRVLTILK